MYVTRKSPWSRRSALLPRGLGSPASPFSPVVFFFPRLADEAGLSAGTSGIMDAPAPPVDPQRFPPRCLVFSRAPFLPRCLFLFPPCGCGGVAHRDEQDQGRTAAPGRGAAAVAAASRSPQGAGSTPLAGVPPCKSSSLVCGCGGGLTMARAAGFTFHTTSTALPGVSRLSLGGDSFGGPMPTTVRVRVPGGGISRAGDAGPATILGDSFGGPMPTTVRVRVPGGGLSRAGDADPAMILPLPLGKSGGDMS